MATLTLAEQRTLIRVLVQDKDSGGGDTGISDAELTSLINEAQSNFGALYPQEMNFSATVSLSSGDEFRAFTGTNTRYLIRADITGSGNLIGAALERLTVPQIRHLQENTGETGTPRYWAGELSLDSATSFLFYPYPIPTGSVSVTVKYSRYPTDLSADSDVTSYGQDASRWFARMAAVQTASILGRNEAVISRIAEPLPSALRAFELKRLGVTKPMADPLRERF